ncbi:interferon-induced protein 44-like [Loxodonta africana]|uniref:interferon-induced protein 44-like n=1 Tax=Loxodonta africana TaxID=9785 RepID=UPI00054038C8|nr:interferon-induced protein 44-like [Loxodonta africana]XP_023405213.1 interferon-induced protein 44-like [Loxodonta africana]
MAVTTRLTWKAEKSLQKLLGHVSLSLLYKSSVHGSSIENMLQRCAYQGSTVTMIYTNNNTFGAFILGHYPNIEEESENPDSSFYFSFKKDNRIEVPTFLFNRAPKITDDSLSFYSCDRVLFCLVPNFKKILIDGPLRDKQFTTSKLHFDYLECEVFRVEGIKNDSGYVRRITRATQHREHLLAELRAYKPSTCLIPELRILMLGPVGSGKSTFINSVKSVFQGRVIRQAIVGSDITSITEQYRIYSIKDGKDGISLPFMLCDSMGLDEKEEAGLCMDDIPHILKGCIPDRYQFNPEKPITPSHSTFITSPSLKERIHCVVFVLDVNSVNNLSSKMVQKLKRAHKDVLHYGIAHVALLTKVANWDEILQDDFLNMNKSVTYKSQIMHVSKMLSIPISNILMVGNYASEYEVNHLKDVLILSMLRQMLRATDDFLDDLPLE